MRKKALRYFYLKTTSAFCWFKKLSLGFLFFFWRGAGGGGQRGTVSPPLEPAVGCSAFVPLDGHPELKSKLEPAVSITNKRHSLPKQAFR